MKMGHGYAVAPWRKFQRRRAKTHHPQQTFAAPQSAQSQARAVGLGQATLRLPTRGFWVEGVVGLW